MTAFLTHRYFVFTLALALCGCTDWRNQDPFSASFGEVDITNDLHHRIKAGIFQPNKEPVTLLVGTKDRLNRRFPAPEAFVRFSWEGGTFWVRSGKDARVNVYLNKDTIFGHVSMAGQAGTLGVQRDFFEAPYHPIIQDFKMLVGSGVL